MRCYFMRGSRIENVAFLIQGPDDELIRQATEAFERNADRAYDGFEVWDQTRFVYRYTAATKTGEKPQTAA